jgi:hypothetical protein
LFHRIHIPDVGAIIDASFAADALSNTDIATASDGVAGMTAHGRLSFPVISLPSATAKT